MKHIKILKKAREILSKPDNWVKNAFARTAEGFAVGSNSEEAVCFCSMGAVRKAWYLDIEATGLDPLSQEWSYYMAIQKLNEYAHNKGHGLTVAGYNDNYNRQHKEILEMFDTVIANEESQ